MTAAAAATVKVLAKVTSVVPVAAAVISSVSAAEKAISVEAKES